MILCSPTRRIHASSVIGKRTHDGWWRWVSWVKVSLTSNNATHIRTGYAVSSLTSHESEKKWSNGRMNARWTLCASAVAIFCKIISLSHFYHMRVLWMQFSNHKEQLNICLPFAILFLRFAFVPPHSARWTFTATASHQFPWFLSICRAVTVVLNRILDPNLMLCRCYPNLGEHGPTFTVFL